MQQTDYDITLRSNIIVTGDIIIYYHNNIME
jgi:hypothetical protein